MLSTQRTVQSYTPYALAAAHRYMLHGAISSSLASRFQPSRIPSMEIEPPSKPSTGKLTTSFGRCWAST